MRSIRIFLFLIILASCSFNDNSRYWNEHNEKRITKEIPSYDTKKLIIRKKSNKEFNLISGPYNTINLVKNDYILLKKFGFEDLDITNE